MTGSRLDHLVYGVPELAAGVRRFAELTGVQPAPGGSHPGLGTANYLVGLDETSYLEILGPDPDSQDPPRWFGLDRLRAPRLLTWAVHYDDLDAAVAAARAAGYDPGAPADLARPNQAGDQLRWRLTPDTVEGGGGLVPFGIEWGAGGSPAANELPRLRLERFTIATPSPADTGAALAALGLSAELEYASEPALRCLLDGPAGLVTLT